MSEATPFQTPRPADVHVRRAREAKYQAFLARLDRAQERALANEEYRGEVFG